MLKMDLKRTGVALCVVVVSLLLLNVGCGKKKPPDTAPKLPPPVTTPPPTTDVSPPPPTRPDTGPTEPERPQDLASIQADFERQGLIGDVYFDFDQYNIRNDAQDRLRRNAEFFRSAEGRKYTYTIEGHCDERGTNEYNIALGQRRAASTLDYLTSMGVDRGSFKSISYGEERPVCTENTESCWQRNRRAHFVISGRVN